MEHLNQLIPFVLLGVVLAILVALLRRTTTEPPLAPVTPERATPTAPAPIIITEPNAAEKVEANPPSTKSSAVRNKPKTKKPAPTPVAVTATPIEAVLNLLKRKDSLAVAFLLREILDRPVSQRR